MTWDEIVALAEQEKKDSGQRKRPSHEEDDIQTSCVKWFSLQYPEYKMLLHHSPNGGKRDSKTGAMFKRMGTRAGFPDLTLLMARQGYHALFVEMKTKVGRQSESQKEYERLLTEQGYRYVVCRSLEDFITIIKGYIDGKEADSGNSRGEKSLQGKDKKTSRRERKDMVDNDG